MGSEIGIFGLGSMGENLAIQLSSKGIKTSVYNRTKEKTKEFIDRNQSIENLKGCYSIDEFLFSLSRPRKIILLVKAGQAVDEVINVLKSKLDEGDIIIDAGNSHFKDTERRYEELRRMKISFIGMGISGGVEGARKGLSIMAGGDERAYKEIKEILDLISAEVDSFPSNSFFGKGGAGHFVKIVHNGIEYAIMENIAEIYFYLRNSGLSNEDISKIFSEWNKQELNSFLLEASSKILKFKENQNYLIDLILDKAEQKGTGRWAAEIALEEGVASPSIVSAVFSRTISSQKERRTKYSKRITFEGEKKELGLEELKDALYLANLSCYMQGFEILNHSSYFGYQIELKEAARVWIGGSIIRGEILKKMLKEGVFEGDIFLSDFLIEEINKRVLSLSKLVAVLSEYMLPSMVISSSLNFLIYFYRERLPANLIQALRDYFGAHGFERIDKQGHFHQEWE